MRDTVPVIRDVYPGSRPDVTPAVTISTPHRLSKALGDYSASEFVSVLGYRRLWDGDNNIPQYIKQIKDREGVVGSTVTRVAISTSTFLTQVQLDPLATVLSLFKRSKN